MNVKDVNCHLLEHCDREAIEKAAKSAEFLVQDLQNVNRSNNPLVAEVAMDILGLAAAVNARLHRILIL